MSAVYSYREHLQAATHRAMELIESNANETDIQAALEDVDFYLDVLKRAVRNQRTKLETAAGEIL